MHHHDHITQYCAGKKWLLSSGVHQPVDLDHTSPLRDEDASAACNRTAAVYLLRDDWRPRARPARLPLVPYTMEDEMALIAAELFQYTHHRWLRPYKSKIDRGQFLPNVNVPPAAFDLPVKACSLAMVERSWLGPCRAAPWAQLRMGRHRSIFYLDGRRAS